MDQRPRGIKVVMKPLMKEELASNYYNPSFTRSENILETRKPRPQEQLNCPRCKSTNTKFCYYNNYSLTQPRYFCKTCRRYWTQGGSLRNVPVGGGSRKDKRSSIIPASSNYNLPDNHHHHLNQSNPSKFDSQNPNSNQGQHLNLAFSNSGSSSMELLRTGGNVFVPTTPMPDPNSLMYPSGILFPLQDRHHHHFKSSLGMNRNNNIVGIYHQEINNGGRVFFPFGLSSGTTTEADRHRSNGRGSSSTSGPADMIGKMEADCDGN